MLVYLASPYSCNTAEERHYRFMKVCEEAAKLMKAGYQVFCPIAHSHPIEIHGMTEMEGHDFWLKQDFAILQHCKKMFVYMLPGWTLSKGVAAEVNYASHHNIPIEYLEFKDNCKLVAA